MSRARFAFVAVLALAAGLCIWTGGSGSARAADDCTHTVAAGQTLGHIANRHGVSQRSLIDANPELKKNPDLLRVGQQLDVCAAKKLHEEKAAKAEKAEASSSKPAKKKRARSCGSGGVIVEHEVASGETLGKIMRHYDVTEREIARRNPALAKDPHMIRVGQTIEICADQRRTKASKLCGYRTPLHTHEVVPGENLGQIAGRYGVRRRDLQRWNASLRSNPDMLRVGQSIRVCPEIAPHERSKITVTVEPGDSLGEIAARYDLTARELERYQRGKLKDPSSLRVGQTLVVWVDGGIVEGFGGVDRDSGVLSGGIQLPRGKHYHIKAESLAWGTTDTVRAIQSAVAAYKRKMPGGPKVHIGDISKKAGGKFPPHNSHQHGRDVDVGYVLTGELADETRFRNATKGHLDVARTWRLVKSFIDTDQVTYIFMDYKIQELLYEHAKKRGASEELLDELFQYPRGRRRTHGLIRHWKGHTNHFHVRFRK